MATLLSLLARPMPKTTAKCKLFSWQLNFLSVRARRFTKWIYKKYFLKTVSTFCGGRSLKLWWNTNFGSDSHRLLCWFRWFHFVSENTLSEITVVISWGQYDCEFKRYAANPFQTLCFSSKKRLLPGTLPYCSKENAHPRLRIGSLIPKSKCASLSTKRLECQRWHTTECLWEAWRWWSAPNAGTQ